MKVFQALIIVVLGWLFLAGFAVMLVGNPNPVWKVIAILGLWWGLFILPGSLDVLGLALAGSSQLGWLGFAMVRLSASLYTLLPPPHRSLRPAGYMSLSRLCVLRGRGEDARRYADRALAVDFGQDAQTKFKVLSTAGDAYFVAGKLPEASEFLSRAYEVYANMGTALPESATGTAVGQWLQARMLADMGEQQANNLDRIGLVRLEQKKLGEAQSYFERSAQLRRQVPSLAPTAQAYLQEALEKVARLQEQRDANS